MVRTGSILRPFLTVILLVGAVSAQGLEIVDLQYNGAFSPNGDDSQDTCEITFTVDGEGVEIDSVLVGIYADLPETPGDPPDSGALLTTIYYDDPTPVGFPLEPVSLELEWDGSSDAGPTLDDGFYYLFIKVVADDTIWLDPPVQLDLNTVGPDISCETLQPSPFFTPLASEADTLLNIFFCSATFNVLTDLPQARIYQYFKETNDSTYIENAEFDWEFSDIPDDLPRYRFLWNGGASQGDLVDGEYRAVISLSDYAGNDTYSTSIDIDMDVSPPALRVQQFGAYGHDTQYTFMSADLPDTITIGAKDRNGVVSCRAAWGSGLPFDAEPVLVDTLSAIPDSSVFHFTLPTTWSDSPDTTLQILFEGTDAAGNLLGDLGSNLRLTIHLDDTPPPIPVWDMPITDFIQQPALIRGRCDETDLSIILYEGGDSVATMVVLPDSTWFWPYELPLGESVWQARSRDEAGNLSPLSVELTLTYSDREALVMPGRFYGNADETIRINAEPGTTGVTMRVYTLDGSMVRMIEGMGDPVSGQYHIDWDLNDSRGRPLLGGLYIVNLGLQLPSGQSRYERKVVALVRD